MLFTRFLEGTSGSLVNDLVLQFGFDWRGKRARFLAAGGYAGLLNLAVIDGTDSNLEGGKT